MKDFGSHRTFLSLLIKYFFIFKLKQFGGGQTNFGVKFAEIYPFFTCHEKLLLPIFSFSALLVIGIDLSSSIENK